MAAKREARRNVAYLDSLSRTPDLWQARLVSLRELQLTSGVELSALMASILDKAFKGEL